MQNDLCARATRNNFVPASRYYGDRYARTMEEAFGPGAKLSKPEVEYDRTAIVALTLAYAFGTACVIAFALWWAP